MLGILTALITAMLSGPTVRRSDGQAVSRSDGQTVTLTAPACKTCRIEKSVVVEFGNDPAAQDAAPDGLMGAMQAGRNFLGVPLAMKAVPVVFGPDGKVVRLLGRPGGGPGEFQGPGLVAPYRGDSVLIADAQSGRFSVFDASWRFVRAIPMGGGYETWVPLADGHIVAGSSPGHSPQPESMTIIDPSGKRVGAFGIPTAEDTAGAMFSGPPLLVTDGRLVWGAPFRGPYRVTEWDPATRRRGRTWVRRGPDFVEKLTGRETSPTQRPEPFVNGFLRVGPLLWVLYTVPAKDWAKGLKQVDMRGERGMVKVWKAEEPDKVFDTIVEAIDIATGSLLASQRFDEYFVGIVSTGTLALHKVENEAGETLSRMVRFDLTGR